MSRPLVILIAALAGFLVFAVSCYGLAIIGTLVPEAVTDEPGTIAFLGLLFLTLSAVVAIVLGYLTTRFLRSWLDRKTLARE